jgi:hypothetical protein
MGVINSQGVGFSLNKKLHIHSEVRFCSRERESHSSRGSLRSVKVTQPSCSITSKEVLLVSFTYVDHIARWEIVLYVQVTPIECRRSKQGCLVETDHVLSALDRTHHI